MKNISAKLRKFSQNISLLIILCAFQSVFIGSDIVVATVREPADRSAIKLEEYGDSHSKINWQA